MLQKEIKENKKQRSPFRTILALRWFSEMLRCSWRRGSPSCPAAVTCMGFCVRCIFKTHTHTQKKCICTFIQPINATVFVLISFSHEAELFQSKLIPRNTNQRCAFVAQEPALSLAELGLGVPAESTASSLPTEPRVGCKPPLQIQQRVATSRVHPPGYNQGSDKSFLNKATIISLVPFENEEYT